MQEKEAYIRTRLQADFEAQFGDARDVRFFFAPSRINIIGEHIDYNGGAVFPCALTIGTYALARPNDLNVLRLYSVNMENRQDISLPLPAYDAKREWANYPIGVAKALEKEGVSPRGMDVVVYGNIPNGSGLSSSASLELLFGVLYSAFWSERPIPTLTLVEAGVWCENDFFGLHTGIMDQYVIGFGKAGHAMVLDTANKTHTYVPLSLEEKEAVLIVLNTGHRRELKDSKYNERRAECDEALEQLNAVLTKEGRETKAFLCAFTAEDLPLLAHLDSEVLRRRVHHVITENQRVKDTVTALQAGDLNLVGDLLKAGHASMRDDYEASGPHLDAIVDAANHAEGCYGARMTGAGFGGCAIALVKKEAVNAFSAAVKKAYQDKMGIVPELIVSTAGDGAGEWR